MNASAPRRATVWALVIAIAASHIVAATSRPAWWGAHFYRFLDPAALWIACALLALAALIAWRWPPWIERALGSGSAAGTGAGPPGAARASWPFTLAMSAASFAIFWIFREAHTLLGDGRPLTHNLPLGQQFHPDEPLALYLHHAFYMLTRGLFARAGREPSEVAHDTVGLSSALAGAVFVPIAWALAREMSLARPAAGEPAGVERGTAILAFVALVSQGYIQLFFGYVENYTLYCLVVAAFSLAAWRALDGRAPLALPGALVIVAAALHLAGGLLVPAFGVLAAQAATRRDRWKSAARDVVILLALFFAMNFALGFLHPHYSWLAMLFQLAGAVTNTTSSYGFKRPDVSDFINQQVLIGPLGFFLFVPALVAALAARTLARWQSALLVALAAAFLLACVIAGDSNLGVARNWDLLAPAGFVFTLAGLGLALGIEGSARERQRWLFLLSAASLFHTVPWIANNASFDRAFARLKTLPLGLGRMQAVVGEVYLERGQLDSASVWFRRALDENPANNLAASQLGRIAMSRGDYDFACEAFIAAAQARPEIEQYHYLLASALTRSGRFGYARREVDQLLRANPAEPIYWAASSVVWQCLGQRDSSQAAIARADQLAPDDSLLHALRADLGRRDGFSAALDAVWPRITLP